MIDVTISEAKRDFSKLITSCLKNDEIIRINIDKGNAVIISEAHYNSLRESLYLHGINKDVEKATKTPTGEFNKNAPWN